jgi:hypothetical protein
MGWMSNLFAKPKVPDMPSPSTSFHDLDGGPVPLKVQATGARGARELVHAAAVHTAQVYGVPLHWLSFEVVTIGDSQKAYFQLQVVMKHWDDYLAMHCYAFELAVMKRIREQDRGVARAVRAVLFRVSPDAGCPYDEMPEPKAWSPEAIRLRATLHDRDSAEPTDPAFTLPAARVRGAAMGVLTAEEADRAGRSTLPAFGNGLLGDDAYSETMPSTLGDFAATQPYAPLMTDVVASSKVVPPPKKS